jgi:ribosomal protein S18 acetylase RimI-like enzyme
MTTPPDAAIVVRPALPEEWDRAGQVCVAAYDAAGQLEPGSPYVAVLADAAGRARDSIVLVAVRGGSVEGTVTICPPGSASREIGGPDEAEFRFLAVDPAAWGRGIGAALVAAVEAHARATGAQALAICVRDTNASAALMYERMGFVRDPDRDWTPRPDVHLLALRRPLP